MENTWLYLSVFLMFLYSTSLILVLLYSLSQLNLLWNYIQHKKKKEIPLKLDLSDLSFVGYAFQIEMKFKLWKKACTLKEIPIVFVNREKGVSKMNSSIIWEAIYGVIYLKFESIYKRK